MHLARVVVLTGALAGLLVGLAGCSGGAGYAPVSGVVTVNGKPCRNATVTFLPEQTKDNPTPGRGSIGRTDDNGRFTLKTVDGVTGAAVGKHHIQIRTSYNAELKGYQVWDPVAKKTVRSDVDPIPYEWHSAEGTKEFDVPAGGTDKANFDIVTGKAANR
jgi:hypothetical protein